MEGRERVRLSRRCIFFGSASMDVAPKRPARRNSAELCCAISTGAHHSARQVHALPVFSDRARRHVRQGGLSVRCAGPADRQRFRQCRRGRTARARRRACRRLRLAAHKQAEVRVIGHDFADYYGWHYPPPFLFVAAALATLPFVAAAIDPGRPCRGTLIVLLLVAQRACCVATKSAAH